MEKMGGFPKSVELAYMLKPCPHKGHFTKSTVASLRIQDGAPVASAIYSCTCSKRVQKLIGKKPKYCAKVRVVQIFLDVDKTQYLVQRPEAVPDQQFHPNLDGSKSDSRVERIDEGRRLF